MKKKWRPTFIELLYGISSGNNEAAKTVIILASITLMPLSGWQMVVHSHGEGAKAYTNFMFF